MGLIKYRDINYGGGGGSNVTPNPSETATANLEKLKIDFTTYAIKDTNAIHESDVGVAGGVAELNNNGKIPDSQLPDYGDNVDLSIVNGAIASTYDDDGTEVTEDIMQDETGDEIATVLDSIAETIQLLGQPEVYAPVVYSLEEREIGVWTDGKPLYQITITNNSGISSVDQWLEIADIGNTKNIIDVDGKIITPVGEVPFNYNGEGSNISYITNMSASVVKALGKITARLSNGANWLRNNPIVMSIQYTKTTDVPGSGNYAALGVPAVHYDDTERVIGTWFGETLYQKTIFIHNTSLVYSQSYSFATDIPNVDIVIDKESLIKLAGSSWVTGDAYTNTSQYRWDIQVNSASKEVGIQCLGWGFTDVYVTLKYTKTS